MNDDLTILASVYLDNAATQEERAQVEASPELLAEVERQRLVRAVLADVDSPSISLRETHLSAALAAWDRLPETERAATLRDTTPSGVDPARAAAAATISTPSPTSSNSRRRSQSTGWMIGAAAALALVLAGGVLLQSVSLGGSDSDSSSADSPQTAADAPDPDSSTAIADDAADEFLRESDLSAEDSDQDGGETFTEAPADLDDIDIDAEAPPQNDDLEVLSTPEELGIFASDAIGAPVSDDVPDATDAPAETTAALSEPLDVEEAIERLELPLCGGADFIVGPAEYQGEFVIVAIDESRNRAVAYLAIDCSVIAIAQLP